MRASKRVLSCLLAIHLITASGVADGSTDPVQNPVLDPSNDVALFISQKTQMSLPAAWRTNSVHVIDGILEAAHRYELSPLMLVAMIKTESRFNPSARGLHGEIGLMQMKPSTAMWLLTEGLVQPVLGLPMQPSLETVREALHDPKLNVMFGAAYIAYLRNIFKGRSALFLAAYNMGTVNLKNRLKDGERPQVYAGNISRELLKLKFEFSKMQQINRQSTVIAAANTAKTFVLK